MSFKVLTPIFEGPLDLLLSLIEKRKLFINDISLAKVTDDYIEHVKRMDQYPISDSAHFILIASTLLLIKSKSLLPTLTVSEEEQGSMDELEKRLALYQRFKELALNVKNLFGTKIIFSKTESKNIVPVFSPEPDITPQSMLAHMQEAINNLPKKEQTPKAVIKKVVSLEDMIVDLSNRVKSAIKMSFKEFSGAKKGNQTEKTHIVVSFLAMLELVKQGIINVNQENQFSDIIMETDQVGVPRYE